MLEDEPVEGWFFVRYADPRPHLRIRYHGVSAALLESYRGLIPTIEEAIAARTVSHVTLSTYDREVERYGGEGGLRCCEEIFEASSEFAIEYSRIPAADRAARLLMTVVSIDILASACGLANAGRHEYYATRVSHPHSPESNYEHAAEYRSLAADLGRLRETTATNWVEALAPAQTRGNR